MNAGRAGLFDRVPPAAVHLPFAAALAPSARAFGRALNDPRRAQERAVGRIVGVLAGSRRFRALRGVRTLRALQDAAPVARFEDFADDIRALERGERDVLSTSPLVRFERSGGSSGAHKLIPFSRAFLDEMNLALGPWLFDLIARHPGVARGASYWSISPLGDHVKRTSGGTPIGADDDTNYFPAPVRALLRRVLAAPAALAHVEDLEACRYATARVLLERADLALISVWSPTFLSLLLDCVEDNRTALADDLERGTCAVDAPALRRHPWRALPERARLLRDGAPPRALWPMLSLLSLWTEGASAGFVADVMRRLPGVPVQGKGLLATEGVVTIPWRGHNVCAVRSHVLEFIDEDEPLARPRFVHEIERGRRYQVLLTTSAGLVRYALGDRVEVIGASGATPTLRFLGRAGLVSDLVGEKLSAALVADALEAALRDAPRGQGAFCMLAPARDGRGYVLFLEDGAVPDPDGVAARVDGLLRASHPYNYARSLGQLAALRCCVVRDGVLRFEAACVQRGQRAGDIKPTPLHLARDWEETFACARP